MYVYKLIYAWSNLVLALFRKLPKSHRALGVIYWKRKRARNTEITKQLPLDNQQGTLPSRYELGSRQPRIPIPDTPTIVQTTAMEREDEDSGPLYECPDPLEDYTEMS